MGDAPRYRRETMHPDYVRAYVRARTRYQARRRYTDSKTILEQCEEAMKGFRLNRYGFFHEEPFSRKREVLARNMIWC